MPLFGQSESSYDASQNNQLLSLSNRLTNIEAISLQSLGGEPAGAELRAKQYTDEEIRTLDFPTNHTHIWGNGKIISPTNRVFNTYLNTGAELGRYSHFDVPGVGDTVEYEIPLKAGTYSFLVYFQRASDRGIAGFFVDNRYVGRIDLYQNFVTVRSLQSLDFTVTTSGLHSIKVCTVGKNSSSSNYFLPISAIYIVPKQITLNSAFQPLRINCGASSDYIDPAANSWAPSLFCEGGTNYDLEANVGAYTVANTDKQALYKTETSSSGTFAYKLPVFNPGSGYKLDLHFSENFHNAAGARVGSVSLNGSVILSNFDVFVQAGGKNRALIRTFSNLTLTNTLNLSFTNLLVNAIELTRL